MKTIDMDDVPENWPPEPGSKRGKKHGSLRIGRPKNLAGTVVAIFVVVVAVLALTGRLGLKSITHQEVAVKVNYLTGSRTVIATPGFQIYLPLVQEIFTFDRTPQKFLMEGKRTAEYNHVPYLTVRAKDGSNFWFESLEITYALIPSMADRLLEDSGPDDGFKMEWIRTYARSVLRDEFGKYSATEVADPSSYQAARIECTARLNDLLQPHGIEVIDVITPKPRFDPEYEKAIDERKVAEQDVKRLKEEENRLLNERERRIAGVDKEKSIEKEALMGDLTQRLKEAERDSIQIRLAADEFKVQRVLSGEAERAQKTTEAEGLRNKYAKEAEGIRKRAEALEKRGEVVVREAVIDKLASIRFTLIPYSRDPEPKRLEHSNAGDRAELASGALGGER